MTGESLKDARRLIRKAKSETEVITSDIHVTLNNLYEHIENQAHQLDGDSTCIACGRWITDTEGLSYYEEGWLCKGCGT